MRTEATLQVTGLMGRTNATILLIVVAVFTGALTSCQNRTLVVSGTDEPPPVTLTHSCSTTKTDILFVIDNSPSMVTQQETLEQNLDLFIRSINESIQQPQGLEGGWDIHIGVTTTEVNWKPLPECSKGCPSWATCMNASQTSGALDAGTGYCTLECDTDDDCPLTDCDDAGTCKPWTCGRVVGLDASKKFCYPTVNGRLHACRGSGCTGFEGPHEPYLSNKTLSHVGADGFIGMFRDNALVGHGGTGWRAGLQAARMALDKEAVDPLTGRNLIEYENRGFLRPEARLVIIFISDRDDCSFAPLDPQMVGVTDRASAFAPASQTCHPECLPALMEGTCTPPYQPVLAEEATGYIQKGEVYCLLPCNGTADCQAVAGMGQECMSLTGFGKDTNFCTCNFEEPTSNPSSRYRSLTPTHEFINFFKGLKKDPNDVVMAVFTGAAMTGDGTPLDCATATGVACAGTRYYNVAQGMSKFLSDSICNQNFIQSSLPSRLVNEGNSIIFLYEAPGDPSNIIVTADSTPVAACAEEYACSVEDGGSFAHLCPEADALCEGGEQCTGTDDMLCDCAAIASGTKGCHCGSDLSKACAQPILWQYVPPSCGSGLENGPQIRFYGCVPCAEIKVVYSQDEK